METQSPRRKRAEVQAFGRRHRTSLITLLFSDMVGSTSLKQKLGDRPAADLFRMHHDLIRQTLQRFLQAEEIETAGDSFLLVFATPSDAVQFALLVQVGLRRLRHESGAEVLDRIGIHVGEVMVAEAQEGLKARDLFGIQIDTCARVMSLAKAGQVLMTRPVFDSARQVLKGEDIQGVQALDWLNHGAYELKGLEEPVEICEVVEKGHEIGGPPTTSDKASRVARPGEERVLGWRPAVGQTVPNTKWVLEQKLGEGGFGEVWLGRHQTMKERRVFKFCFRADRVRFLKREMTLFRLLKERVGDHPNVVRLLGVYFDEPPFYVEMDYAAGSDLRSWWDTQGGAGHVPLALRLEIIAQVADALQAAHDAGIIHRDVKPSNVLIAESHAADDREDQASHVQAKLTDFGIGQVLSEESLAGITRAGFTQTILTESSSSQTGTQLYMAPELLSGEPASIRSDIYSLGVVLYQLLVGDFRRPVTMDWSRQIEDPLLRADLARCFAGHPQERWPGAGQLAENLRSLPSRRAALERQQAEVAARERAAYRRGVIRTAALAGVALAIVIAFGLMALGSAADRRRHLYISDMGVAWQALQDQRVGEAKDLVDKYFSRHFWEEDLRGFEWRWLWKRCRPNFEYSFPHGQNVSCAIFSPDSSQLATGGDNKTVQIFDFKSKRLLKSFELVDGPIDTRAMAYSPDGHLLAVAGGNRLHVWRTDIWQEVTPPLEVQSNWNRNNSVVFSPDGATLAARVPSGVSFWDTTTWQKREPLLPGKGSLGTVMVYSEDGEILAISDEHKLEIRDGRDPTKHLATLARSIEDEEMRVLSVAVSKKHVAAGYRDGVLVVWERETWRQIASADLHQSYLVALAFSPDGQALVTGGRPHLLTVWSLDNLVSASNLGRPPQPQITYRGHSYSLESVSFSKDGAFMISSADDGTAKLWNPRHNPDFPNLPGSEVLLAFTADGQRLATLNSDKHLHYWDVRQHRDLGTFGPTADLTEVQKRALSPNGQQLAYAKTNGTVELWQLDPAKLLRLFPSGGGEVKGLAFTPGAAEHLLIANASGERSSDVVYQLQPCQGVAPARILRLPDQKPPVLLSSVFAVSRDGKRLVVAGQGGNAILFETVDGRSRLLDSYGEPLNSVAFSPDGALAAGISDISGKVCFWETESGRAAPAFGLPTDAAFALQFSPDRKTLIIVDLDNLISLWNLRLRKKIFTTSTYYPMRWDVVFPPTDDALAHYSARATAALGQVELWSVPTLVEIDSTRARELRSVH